MLVNFIGFLTPHRSISLTSINFVSKIPALRPTYQNTTCHRGVFTTSTKIHNHDIIIFLTLRNSKSIHVKYFAGRVIDNSVMSVICGFSVSMIHHYKMFCLEQQIVKFKNIYLQFDDKFVFILVYCYYNGIYGIFLCKI